MGILDEAIREHLELKRQHGADDSELKKLEDEAFGQAERPGDEAAQDPFAEAPTEFMAQPETSEQAPARQESPSIADLQEPPPPASEPTPAEEPPAEDAPVEERPAMEHEIVPEPAAEPEPEPPAHSAEERQAIAEQPTELFEVDDELGEAPSPTDEELVEEEIAEPRLSSADPLADLEEDEEAEVAVQRPAPDDDEDYEDEDDAFWNEQRLSDELDQALEAPLAEDEPEAEDEVDDEVEPAEEPEAAAPRRDEDVLEETPDFLEETPEDDELWFEQKPPKDFDFDD
jgi:hypothetical protein